VDLVLRSSHHAAVARLRQYETSRYAAVAHAWSHCACMRGQSKARGGVTGQYTPVACVGEAAYESVRQQVRQRVKCEKERKGCEGVRV
jgi:hypothetical protein